MQSNMASIVDVECARVESLCCLLVCTKKKKKNWESCLRLTEVLKLSFFLCV